MNQPASNAGTNWLADFDFTITGGGAAPTAAPPGPGFTMSRDDAHSMLNLAIEARKRFKDMQSHAIVLTRLFPPADEPASNGYNERLTGKGSGEGAFGAGLANVERMYAYADELVQKLRKALGITENCDETAAADLKAAGSETQPTGFAG